MKDAKRRQARDRWQAVEDLCGLLTTPWQQLSADQLKERDRLAYTLGTACQREFMQYAIRRRWHPETTPSRRGGGPGSLTS